MSSTAHLPPVIGVSRKAPAVGLAVLVLATCTQPPDARPDGGPDASVVEAAVPDAWSPDAAPDDAGPWSPRFAARRIFVDPSVVCSPIDYTFAAPAHVPGSVGDVIWTGDLTEDPEARASLRARVGLHWSFVWAFGSLTARRDGGLVGMIGPGILLAFDGEGHYDGMHAWGWIDSSGMDRQPQWLPALGVGNDLFVDDRATGWMSRIAFARLDTPSPLVFGQPTGVEKTNADALDLEQSAVVTPDGTIAWLVGAQYVVGSCADGRLRWVVEYDSDPALSVSSGGFALRDGSVLMERNRALLHIDSEGMPIRQVESGLHVLYRGVVEGCGYYELELEGGESALTRRDESTLDDISTMPIAGAFAIAANCDVFDYFVSTDAPATLTRLNPDSSVDWTAAADIRQRDVVPLADDGVAIIPGVGGSIEPCEIQVWDADGTPRDAADCSAGLPLQLNATALRPDGVLLVGYGLDEPRLIAMELGYLPSRTAWAFAGTSWARNGAVWSLPPPADDPPGF